MAKYKMTKGEKAVWKAHKKEFDDGRKSGDFSKVYESAKTVRHEAAEARSKDEQAEFEKSTPPGR